MALDQAYAKGDSVNNTNHATFIPEMWSDEIIAEYEKSLVMKPLVKALKVSGKKGDTIRIPMPVRGEANKKVQETQVTLVADTSGEKIISIDQHWEYSRFIEDVTSLQAQPSMRAFYTDDAGHALATRVDSDLIAAALAGWTVTGHATDTGLVVPAVAGAAGDFSDQAFRDAIQVLDDANVPMDNRKLVIPPSARNHIMGIDRYVSSDFVNGRGVVNGKSGELYGVDIFVSTNLPDNKVGRARRLRPY